MATHTPRRSKAPVQDGKSILQNPAGSSFLTRLPAEMRNEVYKQLLLQSEPITVMNPEDMRRFQYNIMAKRSHWSFSAPQEECEKLMRLGDQFATEFRLGAGISLLRTCRQVCSEAGDILYKANTFTIYHPFPKEDRYDVDDLMDFSAQWMIALGSQLSRLRHVEIDIGVHGWCEGGVPILQLAKAVWSVSVQQLHVSFTRGDASSLVLSDCTNIQSFRSIDRLNAIFNALVMKDALGLRRYAASEHLLSHIFIGSRGPSGHVIFPYTKTKERSP